MVTNETKATAVAAATNKESVRTTPSAASMMAWTALKLVAAVFMLVSAFLAFNSSDNQGTVATVSRRLEATTAAIGDTAPSYMNALMKDLAARKKLFDDTPPEEVKYWFEYSGPLQVRCV
jgi:hypothetical protein